VSIAAPRTRLTKLVRLLCTPRVFTIERPNREGDVLLHQMLAEGGSRTDSEGVAWSMPAPAVMRNNST
jgi:hypothetical protein